MNLNLAMFVTIPFVLMTTQDMRHAKLFGRSDESFSLQEPQLVVVLRKLRREMNRPDHNNGWIFLLYRLCFCRQLIKDSASNPALAKIAQFPAAFIA